MLYEVDCPECRAKNPRGTKACRSCLSSLPSDSTSAPRGFEPDRMRQVQRVVHGEVRLIHGLRWMYVLYAGYLAWLALRVLAAANVSTPSAAVVGHMLFPALAFAIVVVAIRHFESEPFACAVALAGIQTIHLAGALSGDTADLPWLHLAFAVVLWAATAAAARSDRILREWQTNLEFDQRRSGDMRTVGAILLIYGGMLATAMFLAVDTFEVGLVYYASMVVVGAASTWLLGKGAARESLPLRCRWSHALPVTLALTVVSVVFIWWYLSLLRGQWLPYRIHPSTRFEFEAVVAIVVLPALIEEWLCRGVLWTAVRRGASAAATILVTATLFALLHRHGARAAYVVPTQLALGLGLGWLRARTGSLVPCMLAHGAFNASAVWLLRG